MPNWWGSEEK